MSRSNSQQPRTVAVSSEEGEMSIFPTKILLTTDGSSEAELAARTAVPPVTAALIKVDPAANSQRGQTNLPHLRA